MKHLDLFSGIGGFALAARWAGIETVAFCETDPFCRKVLIKHWPGVLKYMDIKDVANPGHIDIITASPPCQPFSVAGKKKGRKDERHLWPETLRIIKLSKPHWVIVENVTGIINMELDNILTDLENENYETRSFIIPACAANAPHRRDRLWIIANLNSERCNERECDWKKRYFQKDKKWNMEEIQSEWEKFKPESWSALQAGGWIELNTKASRVDAGIPNRLDRLKSLGNAIVPQIPYLFMMMIKQIENHNA